MLEKIPLEAFRVFDAACRMMNFSSAGRELNITQAAVSRHQGARGLSWHSLSLTCRGRNLALIPEGERCSSARATLEYLEESLEPFQKRTTHRSRCRQRLDLASLARRR